MSILFEWLRDKGRQKTGPAVREARVRRERPEDGTRPQKGNTEELWTSTNPFQRPLQEAVDFVIRNATEQLAFYPAGKAFLKGKTLLDVGPGQDLGISLVMIGYGAQAIIVDQYPCKWDDAFHPRYYRALRQAMIEHFPDASTDPLDEVLANNEHRAQGLRLCAQGLESVPSIDSNSIDLSISNAVLEHFFDPHRACRELGRITRSGGLGFHQTDFRDHRDFATPLEYLAMNDEEFRHLLLAANCSCGNRLRYTDFLPAFEQAGFDVHFKPNMWVEPAYLEALLPRALPRFRQMPREALLVLGGRFHLTKR